ncbi:MAG: AI-2E family transporter [Chlorobi bacterium]|nr:AI-2E family transporter [Chlorobiota bacterium]
MEFDEKLWSSYKGLRFWVIAACVVIVVAGLKTASNLVTIVLVALFLTSISLSPFLWLRKKNIPGILAIIIVITIIFVILYLFGFLLTKSLDGFTGKLPFYEEKLLTYWDGLYSFLFRNGLIDDKFNIRNILQSADIIGSSKSFVASLPSIVGDPFLVFFIFIFMMLEVKSFGKKMRIISSDSMKGFDKIIKNIRIYFGIKTITSFATGLIVYVALSIIGVDFALLWGLLAFILNFIPSIGSIIAAIPAVILAFIQLGFFEGVITAIVYLVVNSLIGSIIEPPLMGRNLGLSPLIVFISLLFWGYILGPVGMLIAAPLTMILKIIFDSREQTKIIGILLGDEASLINKY